MKNKEMLIEYAETKAKIKRLDEHLADEGLFQTAQIIEEKIKTHEVLEECDKEFYEIYKSMEDMLNHIEQYSDSLEKIILFEMGERN